MKNVTNKLLHFFFFFLVDNFYTRKKEIGIIVKPN